MLNIHDGPVDKDNLYTCTWYTHLQNKNVQSVHTGENIEAL